MFESSDGPLQPPGVGLLDPAALASLRAWLSGALESPSGLDDVGLVDSIRGLEELVCVATAAQARLAVELAATRREERAAAGVPAARRGQGIGEEVALARRESPHRGRAHLGLAQVVAVELPCTWAAWKAGRITEWKATVVARETACLSLEHRLAVDQAVAGDPARLEGMGVRELAAACAAQASRLDPAAVVARRRRAEADRTVTLRPAPDTMTWLTALLPVAAGVAVHTALAAAATGARAAGDGRSRGQVMADTLVDAVLGHGHEHTQSDERFGGRSDGQCDGQSDGQAGAGGDVGGPAGTRDAGGARVVRPRVSLGLVMTDRALFGGTDDPALLEGFGPIPAELAREIVLGAMTDDEQVWLRRLYTSPTTGELVDMDATARLFRGTLARFVRLRDQTCRTPWCDAPVRHVDHVRAHTDQGPTSRANGQGLCEACNHAKQAHGWRARPRPQADDGHLVETTTPTGHTHVSRPPPVATIHHRDLPPMTIDYILTA